MLIAHNNLSDDADPITAGSDISNLPVGNLQEDPVVKVWRTEDSTSSTNITVDMGSQVTIRVIALLGTNLDDADIRIRADNTDSTAVEGDELDTGTVDSQIHKDYKHIYHTLSSDVTAQYWRIDISNVDRTSTGDSYIEAGRLFMGAAWFPTRAASFNWRNQYKDNSSVDRSLGQQMYVDAKNQTRIIEMTLDFLDEDEMYNNAYEIDRQVGRQLPVLLMMRENESDDLRLSQFSIYGLITRSTPISHRTINVFRKRYRIEEQL